MYENSVGVGVIALTFTLGEYQDHLPCIFDCRIFAPERPHPARCDSTDPAPTTKRLQTCIRQSKANLPLLPDPTQPFPTTSTNSIGQEFPFATAPPIHLSLRPTRRTPRRGRHIRRSLIILRRKNHIILQIQGGFVVVFPRLEVHDQVVLHGEYGVRGEVGVVGREDLGRYGFEGGVGNLDGRSD